MTVTPPGGSSSQPIDFPIQSKASGSKSPQETTQQSLNYLDAYVKLTPAQRLRASILDRMGITEDELKNMPAENRDKIEKQIKDEIKKDLAAAEEKKGVWVDTIV